MKRVVLSATRCEQGNQQRNMLFQATQLTFTCSKSTIEMLEKSVEYVQS